MSKIFTKKNPAVLKDLRENWEIFADFTQINKKGILATEILKAIKELDE